MGLRVRAGVMVRGQLLRESAWLMPLLPMVRMLRTKRLLDPVEVRVRVMVMEVRVRVMKVRVAPPCGGAEGMGG